MEEESHIIDVIKTAKESLTEKDVAKLRELSNQTIHQASTHQDVGCITLAVLIYTLSKLIERKDYEKIKNWNKFVMRFNSFMDLAVMAIHEKKEDKYNNYLEMARKSLTVISVNLKKYIQEVLRKAAINKASKIYEHGLSMETTAKMLGVTLWELSEYMGQRHVADNPYNESFSVKKRAEMALEFFK